jgi:hypothetical protein
MCSPSAQFGHAADTLERLREEIDSHLFTDALQQLQQRTWLLHWSNFVFWSIPDGPGKLLDLLLQDRYTVSLQINAPHLLRCAPSCLCAATRPTGACLLVWLSHVGVLH